MKDCTQCAFCPVGAASLADLVPADMLLILAGWLRLCMPPQLPTAGGQSIQPKFTFSKCALVSRLPTCRGQPNEKSVMKRVSLT